MTVDFDFMSFISVYIFIYILHGLTLILIPFTDVIIKILCPALRHRVPPPPCLLLHPSSPSFSSSSSSHFPGAAAAASALSVRHSAVMVDSPSSTRTSSVPEIKPLDQYDFDRAKTCASVRWLLSKWFGSAGTDCFLFSSHQWVMGGALHRLSSRAETQSRVWTPRP